MYMKKAVIITGQLRSVELTKWFHKNYFINDDVDIFLSINKNNKLQSIYKNSIESEDDNYIKEIIKFYNPKDYFIGDDSDNDLKIYDDYKNLCNKRLIYYDNDDKMTEEEIHLFLINQKEKYIKETMNINNLSINTGLQHEGTLHESTVKGLFAQYFFVKKGYELLKKYKETHNIKYDFVLRIRFDHIFLTNNLINNHLKNYEKINDRIIYSEKNIIEASKLTKIELNYDNNKENTINVISGGVFNNKYIYVNDFYWTHGDDLIDKMLNFYNELSNVIDYRMCDAFPNNGAGIEHYLAVYLHLQNIKISRTIMDNVNLIRQIN